MYRCVKAKDSDDVIAIGMDENQGGQAYHDLGTWCDFTFEEIPTVPQELAAQAMKENKSCLKVVGNTVVAKDKL